MENMTKKIKEIENILERVCLDMCEKYCKYPDTWDDEAEGYELCESEICKNCPLQNLG